MFPEVISDQYFYPFKKRKKKEKKKKTTKKMKKDAEIHVLILASKFLVWFASQNLLKTLGHLC